MRYSTTRADRVQVLVPALLLAALIILLLIAEAMGAEAPWADYLHAVDQAIANRDSKTATWALGEAHGAALGSRRWEGMLAVGDAALRVGAAFGSSAAARTQARRVYLTALLRAHDTQSVDGVLFACDAFAGLGDRRVVDQCLWVADDLARRSRDERVIARVRAFAERLVDRQLTAGGHRVEP
ncbi:MAG: hypothetical protein HY728_10495 [Candidatus Rokubacteria bacterium]|nr:hypothetical protein [Candidatus Rokubacteria bacterium]